MINEVPQSSYKCAETSDLNFERGRERGRGLRYSQKRLSDFYRGVVCFGGGGGLGQDRGSSLISTSSQRQADRCDTQKREHTHREKIRDR